MKVSVVVTVLNEEDSVDRLIVGLLEQTKKPDEIIIVDGGSIDKTVSNVENNAFSKRLRIFTRTGNRSVGRNYGIQQAKGEIIAVTDAGGYPKEDWLQKITKAFIDKKVQIVSGFYLSLAKTPFERCITPYFLVMPDKIYKNREFLPSSRSVAFRKSIWKKMGGYPQDYSHNEDLVFDYRLKKAGVQFHFKPDAIVYWQPPKNLLAALKTFYRFSLGDAQANIPRPTVSYIYYRYLIGLFIFGLEKYVYLILFLCLYLLWSVQKNWRYAKIWQGVFLLPMIQVSSDLTIMWGHLAGKVISNKQKSLKTKRDD